MNYIRYGSQTIDKSDIKSVNKCLTSNFLTTGPEIIKFEYKDTLSDRSLWIKLILDSIHSVYPLIVTWLFMSIDTFSSFKEAPFKTSKFLTSISSSHMCVSSSTFQSSPLITSQLPLQPASTSPKKYTETKIKTLNKYISRNILFMHCKYVNKYN